jgi:transposase-like protein
VIDITDAESIRQIMLLLHERGVERDEETVAREVKRWHLTNGGRTKDMGHAYKSLLIALRKEPNVLFIDVFREIEE